MIEINPILNTEEFTQAYRKDNRVMIDAIFQPHSAMQTQEILMTNDAFDYAYVKHGKPAILTTAESAQMTPQQQHQMRKEILEQASQGVGYLYGRQTIGVQSDERFLAVKHWLSDKATLDMVIAITGHQDISKVSVQATKYMHGHFLTRHNDIHPSEKRRVSFELNFSHDWHPDWGGLLQFYETSGKPRDTWAPVFNTLALYDVQHIQSVTYLAPLARYPRVAISGWFLAD